MTDEDEYIRHFSFDMLGELECTLPTSLAEPVIESLGDSSPKVRTAAMEVLSKIGWRNAKAVPVLVNSAKNDKDPAIRSSAFSALQQVRSNKTEEYAPIIQAYQHGMQDETPEVRMRALYCLKTICSTVRYNGNLPMGITARKALETAGAKETLLNASQDSNDRIRVVAEEALACIGYTSQEMLQQVAGTSKELPTLLKILQSHNDKDVMLACGTLAKHGPKNVDFLMDAIRGDEQSRYWNRIARDVFGAWDTQFADLLIKKAGDDPNPMVRRAVLMALTKMPLKELPAYPVKMLKDKDQFVRRDALNAIVVTGGAGWFTRNEHRTNVPLELRRKCAEALMRADVNWDGRNRYEFVSAMKKFAETVPEARTYCLTLFKKAADEDERGDMALNLVSILGTIPASAPERAAILAEILDAAENDKSDRVRRMAVIGLGRSRSLANESRSTLTRIRDNDPSAEVRDTAAGALRNLR